MARKKKHLLRGIKPIEIYGAKREAYKASRVLPRIFIGIEPRTSVLTRLNYARDLEIFFDFLQKKHPRI